MRIMQSFIIKYEFEFSADLKKQFHGVVSHLMSTERINIDLYNITDNKHSIFNFFKSYLPLSKY